MTQTPDEMYFGTGGDIPEQWQAARVAARQRRMEAIRSRTCATCEVVTPIS